MSKTELPLHSRIRQHLDTPVDLWGDTPEDANERHGRAIALLVEAEKVLTSTEQSNDVTFEEWSAPFSHLRGITERAEFWKFVREAFDAGRATKQAERRPTDAMIEAAILADEGQFRHDWTQYQWTAARDRFARILKAALNA